jgi:hypothetical protein
MDQLVLQAYQVLMVQLAAQVFKETPVLLG